MPLARYHKLDPERRLAILDAAAEEFATHGYDAASINRIITAAGISKGAIYYYFEDKLDLFVTVIEDHTRRSNLSWAIMTAAADADAWWSGLHALVDRSWRYTREHPVWIGLGRALVQIPREQWSAGRLGEMMARHISDLHDGLAHGQAIGAIRTDLPVDLLAQMSMTMGEAFDRWFFTQWDEADDDARKTLYRAGLENFQRLLLPFPAHIFAAWNATEEEDP